MKIKHKLLSDYQHLSNDKKIFLVKSGTILNNYTYKIGDEEILINHDIINSNPGIFNPVDWRQELHSYIKSNKFPQPKTLAGKLEPFIEEMILTSISSDDNIPKMDDSMIKELEWKESELVRRENNIKYKEEEIDIRLKRIDKRDSNYKEDLKELDKKEDELRERSRSLTEREINIEDLETALKDKERNLDRNLLEISKDIDIKYVDMQKKIDQELKEISEKEKELKNISDDLKRRSDDIEQREADLSDKVRDLKIKEEELSNWAKEVNKFQNEIKEWEGRHWKFKRNRQPPSTI